MEGILLDLSEDGLDVLAAQPLCPAAIISAHFALPDQGTEMDIRGEVAWANPNGESGVRYIDLPDNLRQTLKDLGGHQRGGISSRRSRTSFRMQAH